MNKKTKLLSKGFSTIEIMVALTILAFVFTPIIALTLGDQSMSVDSETNHAALLVAKKNIEVARAALRADFNLSSVSPDVSDAFYHPDIDIPYISPCSRDIKSLTNWFIESRNPFSEISTIITSPEEAQAMGGLCDPLPPTGDWDAPRSFDVFGPSDFDGQGTGVDVAYVDGTRYAFLVTDADSSGDNFYIIDTTDPENIVPADDITALKIGVEGLNAVTVVGDYAYALYASEENQLVVVNVGIPSVPDIIENGSNLGYTLPNVTAGETPIPTSIFYYDQKLYIGTEYLFGGDPGFNEELHIFDLSSDPSVPVWQKSVNVDRDINSIVVRDNIAYLATGPGSSSPYTPLKVYDLSTESEIDEFVHSDDWSGKSLYLLGDKLYFGLKRESTGSYPEFYILDSSNLNELGSKVIEDFTPASSAGITGIHVQGNLAFLVTTDANNERLYIADITPDPITGLVNPVRINTCHVPPIPQAGTGIVYADNYLFVSIRSNEAFRIIYPSDTCS